jgi:Cu-Zn family superoxide dismutase
LISYLSGKIREKLSAIVSHRKVSEVRMTTFTRVSAKGLPGNVLLLLAAAMFLAMTILATVGAREAYAQSTSTATAELEDNEGSPAGTAEFVETPQGVEITVSVTGGVEPGVHGIHIHEKGDISSSDFKSAGGHFNPTDAKHGFDNPKGPHAGDLENLTVAEDGTATYQTTNDRITLSEGPNSILDSNGSALVIHEMEDDYRTNDDPETGPGTSGDRAVAGVIEASSSQPLPDTGGISPLAPVGSVAAAALLISAGAGLLVIRRSLRA